MAKLSLTLACDSYDYLHPLLDGEIEPEGIDLKFTIVESGLRHQRMYRDGAYDACEFSMSSYLVARSKGVEWFQAIPFFTRRMFGHKFCFIRKGSGFQKPSDLRGGRIGIRSYENTLALVVKGMFMNDYGLPVDSVTWVCTNRELAGANPPKKIRLEHVDGGKKLPDLLMTGEVDAEVEPDLPGDWLQGKGSLQRLFPDFEREEREYYQKTRIFPIMHPVVIKKEILDRDPWVAVSLYNSFLESKRLYTEYIQQPYRLSFAWARSYLEREREFFGRDPFLQGIRENRYDLETMIRFAEQQGMLDRPLVVEELFTENTEHT